MNVRKGPGNQHTHIRARARAHTHTHTHTHMQKVDEKTATSESGGFYGPDTTLPHNHVSLSMPEKRCIGFLSFNVRKAEEIKTHYTFTLGRHFLLLLET